MRSFTPSLLCATLVSLAACGGNGGHPNATGAAGSGSGAAGQTGAAGSGGAGAGAAGTGAAGSGPAGTGAAGTASAGAGAAGTGGAGTGAAGQTGAAGTQGNPDGAAPGDGSLGGDFPTGDCAAGAIFCEGFEDYPILANPYDSMGNSIDLTKMGETTPTWLSYHFHGPPRVDMSKPFKGKKNFHIDTESGHTASADIIKEGPDGADLWPAAHYGRVMVWLKSIPPSSAWGIMTEQGLLPGSTTEVAQYTLGGEKGKLAFTYTQRKRVVKNDVSSPKVRRGGDAQPADPMPIMQCRVTATAQALKAGQWACVEWSVDRTKSELHLWVDGQAQTEVDFMGKGGVCTGAVTPAGALPGPAHFTELDLGWEVYGNDGGPAWEAWFDEFAIGSQRLGCPTP